LHPGKSNKLSEMYGRADGQAEHWTMAVPELKQSIRGNLGRVAVERE